MDLKKKIKGFFTLTRKANSGFTLVELIVVIAILAILGGVAVPAYSGYVTKANKSADEQLIADIEKALTLSGYNGALQSGYVVVSADDEPRTSGTDVDAAMAAVFGEGWEDSDTMKLKYDSWGSSGIGDLTADGALCVKFSSYMTGDRKDVLLSDVEKMTSMAAKLAMALGSADEGDSLTSLFGEDVLKATAEKYGITLEDGQTLNQWANTPGNETAYGNLLVLTVADEISKKDTGELSGASKTVLNFSSYYAFAAQNPAFSAELDTYMEELNDVETLHDASEWYTKVREAAEAQGYGITYDRDQQFIDSGAFSTIMAGLGNGSAEQAANIGADLNNANLFTEGTVNGIYNGYLDAVDVMTAPCVSDPENNTPLEFHLAAGEVLILLNTLNGEINTRNSLPSA